KNIVVGRDVRNHGQKLKKALIDSLVKHGVNVIDIGVITTDQLYFAVGIYGFDGGISVTASHNPGEYNGFKFSEAGGAPIESADLVSIGKWAASDNKLNLKKAGGLSNLEILDDYIEHVLSYIEISAIKPFTVLANANFGAVG